MDLPLGDCATLWTYRYSDYTRIDRVMVSLQGKMEWLLPEGRFPSFRSRLLGEEWVPGQ